MSAITTATRMWLTRSTRPFSFTDNNDERLDYDNASNLGLYVHIPFCQSICSFCPYCKRIYDPELANRYVDALKREISLVTEGHDQREVTSLYFGGGTPALVADRVSEIIDELRKHFVISDGIGLELHPRDVTQDRLATLANAGVTRISIGVQSFSDDYLSVLGRNTQNWDDMAQALQAVPFETVSMDFIFALPGQTLSRVRQDIEQAFSYGANHVALYPFIDFSYTKRSFPKMSDREKRELLAQITEWCQSAGLVRDSIWTFAKPGTPKYSSMTRENFLGFGCSATTLLPDQFKINTFSVDAYLSRIHEDRLPSSLTLRFTERQRMVYWLFWTAYTMGVDSTEFKRFFGKELEACYGMELSILMRMGLIQKEGTRYIMTTDGAWWYHYYEHFYTLSYIDQMWNLMRKEAFPENLVIG